MLVEASEAWTPIPEFGTIFSSPDFLNVKTSLYPANDDIVVFEDFEAETAFASQEDQIGIF